MAGAATRKQPRPLRPIETSTPQQTPEPTTDTAVLALQASVAPPGHTASDTPGHGGTPSHMALQAKPKRPHRAGRCGTPGHGVQERPQQRGVVTTCGPARLHPQRVDVARQATERKNDPKHATLGYGVDPLNCAR